MYHNLNTQIFDVDNRVHGPSYVVAPAIGHKLTFLWEVPPAWDLESRSHFSQLGSFVVVILN